MPLRNLPIKTGHLFIGLAVIMFIITVSVFSSGKKGSATVAAKPQKIATQEIVVPLIPISKGTTITLNDVTSVKWPKEFLPKGVTFEDTHMVAGRVAKQDLFPGEPIFTEKVSGSDTNGGLPAVIPNGMRAISVAVTEVKGVAGFVKPGDRVDVLSTFEVDKGEEKVRITRTVLQNVLVLASAQTMVKDTRYDIDTPDGVTRGEATPKPVEKDADKQDTSKKSREDKEKTAKQREKERKDAEKAARLVSSVTLAVTPEQVEKMALAEETGEIRLSLRPETDHQVTTLGGVNFNQLLSGDSGSNDFPTPSLPSAPTAPAVRMGTQVEFIQGSEKPTVYSFSQ